MDGQRRTGPGRSPDPDRALLEAAEHLFAAAAGGTPIDPVRTSLPPGDLDAAYAVQNINTRRALAAGRRLVGRKIGLTSEVVQRQLGVDRPDFGMLFADMAVGDGLTVSPGRVMQPRIEAEVALVLERDLDAAEPSLADLVLATAFAAPALEIVGSRIAGWDINIVDTIADNASAGLFVLGGPMRRLDGLDLRGAQMSMRRNGDVVSEGSGALCLGHPLNAALWLAAEVAKRGRPLRAGDVVLTGALGPMVAVMPGDAFDATISGLGQVAVAFSSEA